jgi:catechol 2,3-dioxygenase-like lactoylglutathione lyase family enzyme
VLIRVRTAGAGFPDVMMAAGHFPLLGEPPFGLGEEAAGEVVAVPPGSRFAVGDQVTGITGFLEGWGGYAEYAYLREGSAIRIPAGMTDEEAGGFPIGFRTAYAGLVERAPVESRSAGHGAAHRLIVMDITIHTSSLPHDDPDASLAFYRDALGFEVRSDVGQGKMRWITVGPVGQPGTSILLAPPAADPGVTEDERRTIAEMMAKGTYGWILLATRDLDGTFEKLQAGDAEVVQEPTEQPYGIRDCAFRDPAGNLVRIQELR